MTQAVRKLARPLRRRVRAMADAGTSVALRRRHADVAVFHDFRPPPYGGGNQFMLALVGEFERRGLAVERNQISGRTPACLFNSYNFRFDRLRAHARAGCRLVHRVDGPIGVYRGSDDGTDGRIAAINAELAHATIFQSEYSLRRHNELGLEFADPHIVRNAVDPRIFHACGRTRYDGSRPLRVISTSWSDNPNKGGEIYAWLASVLDPTRFEYTFVGRIGAPLANGCSIPPVTSARLAEILRSQDVFVTASLHDPCSNALLEALACGLPAIYIQSGGHPELVGAAGFGFRDRGEIPGLLERASDSYGQLQSAIRVPSIEDVADAYLAVLRGHEGAT